MNKETAVTTIPTKVPVAVDIQLTSTQPDEIASAQVSLIEWAKHKIAELQAERSELSEAHQNAVDHKWAASPLKRQVDKTQKRVEFYEKLLSALEHGYVIIPNFPVTVFAIRTNKESPDPKCGNYRYARFEQDPQKLPEGEGEYRNPFPQVMQEDAPTEKEPQRKDYWCEEWKELEFPLQMAKVNIMDAASRAMALKVFDDFGILPGKKNEDPIIVARLLDPRSLSYNKRFITFMVAWHLNTRDL